MAVKTFMLLNCFILNTFQFIKKININKNPYMTNIIKSSGTVFNI